MFKLGQPVFCSCCFTFYFYISCEKEKSQSSQIGRKMTTMRCFKNQQNFLLNDHDRQSDSKRLILICSGMKCLTLTMLWEFFFMDLRWWVPQELVTQLRIRLWSALVIFSYNQVIHPRRPSWASMRSSFVIYCWLCLSYGYLNISDYTKFDIFHLSRNVLGLIYTVALRRHNSSHIVSIKKLVLYRRI